jgi:hypothetical protein
MKHQFSPLPLNVLIDDNQSLFERLDFSVNFPIYRAGGDLEAYDFGRVVAVDGIHDENSEDELNEYVVLVDFVQDDYGYVKVGASLCFWVAEEGLTEKQSLLLDQPLDVFLDHFQSMCRDWDVPAESIEDACTAAQEIFEGILEIKTKYPNGLKLCSAPLGPHQN